MNRRGFTVVELLIVITVMGILLILGVVNLRSTQVNARDTERKTDIENIALHLENFFISGNDSNSVGGRYPSTAITTNGVVVTLRDADLASFIAPGASSLETSFIAAVQGVAPQPTTSQYIYQPLQPDETLCTSGLMDCRKFNLFYRLESDNQIYMVTSKNQ